MDEKLIAVSIDLRAVIELTEDLRNSEHTLTIRQWGDVRLSRHETASGRVGWCVFLIGEQLPMFLIENVRHYVSDYLERNNVKGVLRCINA